MLPRNWLSDCRLIVIVLAATNVGWGQQITLPPGYGSPAPAYSTGAPGYTPGAPAGAVAAPGYTPPTATHGFTPGFTTAPTQSWGAPVGTPSVVGGDASLAPGIQPFDPYAMPSGAPVLPPSTGYPGTYPGAPIGAPPALPGTPPPGLWAQPGTGIPPYTPAPTGVTAAPYTPYGTAPPPGNPAFYTNMTMPPFQRLFQDTGFDYSFVGGSNEGDGVMVNRLDLSTSMVFPNFLGSTGAARVTPGFAFNWLDGPKPPYEQDLPSRLYDAYLGFGWAPQFSPQVGGELDMAVGVYSDFTTVSTDSLRFTGTGVGIIRLSPAAALKLGVTYLDRADLKLLPVVGVLYQPNPQTRWDITFPTPKLAHYCSNRYNTELWWYIRGEYGGGSWFFERVDEPGLGVVEQVDLNDIRVAVGIEGKNLNRFTGYLEIGYVFNRELVYVVYPEETMELKSGLLLGGGLRF